MRTAAALLLLAAMCGGPSPMKIGGSWIIDEGVKLPESGPQPRSLVRETAAGRVTVDRFVEMYRFHEPDCVVYQTAAEHDVFAVCGDRTPVRITSSLGRQWRFEPGGLHRSGSPRIVSGRVIDDAEVIPIDAIVSLAQRQPPFHADWQPGAGTGIPPTPDQRPLDVNARRPGGTTHLAHAAANDRADLVDALLASGADPNGRSRNGATPLMIAAGRGNREIVERLLAAKAEVNLQDNRGATALMYAAGGGKTDIVRLLITHGADTSLRDAEGRTAFERERQSKDQELIDLLKP